MTDQIIPVTPVVTEPKLPTQDEIVARIKEVEDEDFFGFERSDLLERLDFAHAKPLLKEEATEEQWKDASKPHTREAVVAYMLEYMDFAWEKANNCRGLSASRTIDHYKAWTWLAGDYELAKALREPYEFYGKPHLIKICEHYGWDHKKWDDGVRANVG